MNQIKRYMIEYFESDDPSYDCYLGEDAYEAIQAFKEENPQAKIENVCLILDLEDEIYESND